MNIAMLGSGAYGIALSKVLYENNNKVTIWTKFEEEKNLVSSLRENPKVLPGIKIPEDILITTNIKEAVKDSDVIFLAIPMGALRSVVKLLEGIITESQILCITSKGVELETELFPSEVIKEVLDFENVAMLSGPSFAIELATGAETGFVVASESEKARNTVKKCIESRKLIIETSPDIIGVQILATTKNIYAILLGILEGMEVSESTRASALKCIINDSRKLLELLGGNRKTAYSYAGLGDLLLTCMSDKSRNFSFGKYIVNAKNIDDALSKLNTNTVEGIYSLKAIYKLLKASNIDIKSINYIYDVLYNNKNVDFILENLS